MSKDNKAPNPYGKIGGLQHQKKVEEIIELHQVGKQTKDGRPIKRERIVIDEIEKEIGIKPKFHPYN